MATRKKRTPDPPVEQTEDGSSVSIRLVEKRLDDMRMSNVTSADETEQRFMQAGAIEPPYSPATLASLFEISSSLEPNIAAYCTNIDGFGHKLEPVIDLDASNANERIEQTIVLEREHLRGSPFAPVEVMLLAATPTPEEVAIRRDQIARLMLAEKTRVDFFLNNCCFDESFISLRRKIRKDLEMIGNAWFEVLRNKLGEIRQFTYIPGYTMRLMPLDHAHTEVKIRQRTSDIEFTEAVQMRRLRRHIQIQENNVTFFKQIGDPRLISKSTGRVYPSEKALLEANPKDCPATEVIHMTIHSSRSAYGIPRWIGNLLSVMGSRSAEEVNYLYFDNKAVPPLVVVVNDGKLTDTTVKRLEDKVNSAIKGKKNYHKILILEGVTTNSKSSVEGNPGGKMSIDIKPLTEAQNKDGLFLGYDERNADKIGGSFRLPRLLRGDIRDFNRASAESALEFTEQQVFAPERNEFDHMFNRLIFDDLEVKYWRFVSLTPSMKDSRGLAEIIQKHTVSGIITPNEARELSQDVFNREFPKVDAAWGNQPMDLTLAGASPGIQQTTDWTGEADFVGEYGKVVETADPGKVRALLALRDELISQEVTRAKAQVMAGKIASMPRGVALAARKTESSHE